MTNLNPTFDSSYMWVNNRKRVYIYSPKKDDFDIESIAAALSKICRFGGQCRFFYSVASHSIKVADNCPPHLKLHGLLHDASEAYIQDIIRPIKLLPEIKHAYGPIEERFMKVIAKKFQFAYNKKSKAAVKKLERSIELAEIRDIMDLPGDEIIDLSEAHPDFIRKEVLPRKAEQMFLDKYWEIINGEKQ